MPVCSNKHNSLFEAFKCMVWKCRAFKLVDEVTTCWASVDLKFLSQAKAQKEVKLPLWMGKLLEPGSHEELAKYHRK